MTTFGRRNAVSDRGPAPPGEVRRWRAFALLAVAFFMTNVDLTIVNVALPTIGRKLHFPESDLQWVVSAYALTYGGFTPARGAGPYATCSAAGACSWPGWRSSPRPRSAARWLPAPSATRRSAHRGSIGACC